MLAITGELADLAEAAVEQAKRVLVNARRVGGSTGPPAAPDARRSRPSHRRRHPADRARPGFVWLVRPRPGKTRRVSLHDGDARPIRKGSLATPTQFGYTGQVTDNRDGIVVDYEIEAGMPPDAPRLAPAIARAITATGLIPDAVTADRGYGQASVDPGADRAWRRPRRDLAQGQARRRSPTGRGRRRVRRDDHRPAPTPPAGARALKAFDLREAGQEIEV